MAKGSDIDGMSDEQFHAIARAVADPRRFSMLEQIAACRDGMACSTLVEHQEIGAPTVSHHMKELTAAGLVHAERAGRGSILTFERKVWRTYVRRLREL